MIQVSTHITFKDYLLFNYGIFFKSRWVLFIISLFIILAIFLAFLYLTGELNLTGDVIDYKKLPIPLGIVLLALASIFLQSKGLYNSNKGLKDPIVYTFSEDGVISKGASFESSSGWNLFHKVIETRKFFLFYQTNLTLNLVPKGAFENREQIKMLRGLIASQPNLKKKLRKD